MCAHAGAVGMGIVAALSCAACGSSGSSTDDAASTRTCRVDMAFTGAVEGQLGSDDQACAIATGPSVSFVPLGGEVGATLQIDIEKGQTGTFPAVVEIARQGARWRTKACTVAVESHTFVDVTPPFQRYAMRGTGSCTAPAEPAGSGGSGTVTIQPFTFVFRPIY